MPKLSTEPPAQMLHRDDCIYYYAIGMGESIST